MPTLPSGSIDLILCDLPYGTTACAWDSMVPLDRLWSEYRRVIKPQGAIVLTASQPFTTTLIASNMRDFRYEWIWRKNAGSNFMQTKYQPMKEHESVLVFGRGRLTYNPVKQPRSQRRAVGWQQSNTGKRDTIGCFEDRGNLIVDADFRCPSSVQDFKRERGLHPTQKPVAHMDYMIRTYTHPGETVLDNCIRSGTTAVAAIRAGREWIGIERDPEFYEMAKKRIAAERATK